VPMCGGALPAPLGQHYSGKLVERGSGGRLCRAGGRIRRAGAAVVQREVVGGARGVKPGTGSGTRGSSSIRRWRHGNFWPAGGRSRGAAAGPSPIRDVTTGRVRGRSFPGGANVVRRAGRRPSQGARCCARGVDSAKLWCRVPAAYGRRMTEGGAESTDPEARAARRWRRRWGSGNLPQGRAEAVAGFALQRRWRFVHLRGARPSSAGPRCRLRARADTAPPTRDPRRGRTRANPGAVPRRCSGARKKLGAGLLRGRASTRRAPEGRAHY